MKWSWIFLFLPLALIAHQNKKRDFQVWNTDSITIPLSKRVFFSSDIEFRYKKYARNLYYKQVQAQLHFYLTPSMTIGPGYKQISHLINHQWDKEHTPLCDLMFYLLKNTWQLSDRNRIEYRILPNSMLDGKNRWVYRNRLSLMPPFQLIPFQLSCYLSDEIFWQEGLGISENRALFGLVSPSRRKCWLSIYYMRRWLKTLQKNHLHQNIIGINILFRF